MDYKWSKKTLIKEEGSSGRCNKTTACPRKGCCVKKDTPFEIEDTNQLLTLMSIYQSEWAHYDSIVWRHAFTYFGFIFGIKNSKFLKPLILQGISPVQCSVFMYFPLFLPLRAETRESFLCPADHLVQQPCGSTLRFPCSVSVD